jgi:hypothetical protein
MSWLLAVGETLFTADLSDGGPDPRKEPVRKPPEAKRYRLPLDLSRQRARVTSASNHLRQSSGRLWSDRSFAGRPAPDLTWIGAQSQRSAVTASASSTAPCAGMTVLSNASTSAAAAPMRRPISVQGGGRQKQRWLHQLDLQHVRFTVLVFDEIDSGIRCRTKPFVHCGDHGAGEFQMPRRRLDGGDDLMFPLSIGLADVGLQQRRFVDRVTKAAVDEDQDGLPGEIDPALVGLDHRGVPGRRQPSGVSLSAVQGALLIPRGGEPATDDSWLGSQSPQRVGTTGRRLAPWSWTRSGSRARASRKGRSCRYSIADERLSSRSLSPQRLAEHEDPWTHRLNRRPARCGCRRSAKPGEAGGR